MGFTVLIDTREKQPWDFLSSDVLGREFVKLDAGDYTIDGLEDVLAIERKRHVAELATNVTEKRFHKWLERMALRRFKYILIECDLQNVVDYPVGSTVPRKLWSKLRITGSYLMKCISQIQVKYGIHVVFCSNANTAAHLATNIMKRVVEKLDDENNNTQT